MNDYAEVDGWVEAATAKPVGAKILDDIYEYLGRFVAYPSNDCRIAHTLWVAHTHRMDAWESTPRIAFLSPEPGSGKSRALEVTEPLVPRPVEAVNVSSAYLFRKVSDPEGLPTILFDEIDTVFGPKARDNEDIRGMLNAGHRRGATAGRCVMRGNTIETEELPAYCAVAFAGLGDLPDTILTRSVVIRMRRRAPNEKVEPYRRRMHAEAGYRLRDRLAKWASELDLYNKYPKMPEGVEDRDADVWEALLAMADAAGGDWPGKARVTAVTAVTLSRKTTPSLGIRLLSDLRMIFGEEDALWTETILEKLIALEEAPWGDLRGKPLDARGLAQRLKKYEVSSKTIRKGDLTSKGYNRKDLWDSWSRYLPALGASPQGSVTSVTSDTKCPRCDGEGCAHCES